MSFATHDVICHKSLYSYYDIMIKMKGAYYIALTKYQPHKLYNRHCDKVQKKINSILQPNLLQHVNTMTQPLCRHYLHQVM